MTKIAQATVPMKYKQYWIEIKEETGMEDSHIFNLFMMSLDEYGVEHEIEETAVHKEGNWYLKIVVSDESFKFHEMTKKSRGYNWTEYFINGLKSLYNNIEKFEEQYDNHWSQGETNGSEVEG